jgi:catechol 2,3-dioxygenase-like lactoylglutathione lyase family enzyme
MKLELVPLPVSDVDTSKAFYVEKLDFVVDVDVARDGMRVVQLTPPGSACSIMIGSGIPEIDAMPTGAVKALHLVVADAVAARDEFLARGLDVGEVEEHPQGMRYVRFADPDGNSWVFQEMPWRSPEFSS